MSIKTISKSNVIRKIACWLGAQYIRLIYMTGNWHVVRGERVFNFWDNNKPFILAFWHGRLMMMPYSWRRGHPVNMLISRHSDGQLIAHIVKHFGINTVSGSTSKGGVSALRTLIKLLKAGECVGITPDGPRGPRMRVSDGIISLARLSGAPILPATFSTTRGPMLGTWDRFLLAAPFCRGVIVWGEPLYVDRHADDETLERIRSDLECQMNAITQDADEEVGRRPISPAPSAHKAPAA